MESLSYFHFVTMSCIPVKDHLLYTAIYTTTECGGNQQYLNDTA